MSNYTEGKKALAAGDFADAERKLMKSLDNRPNDGEVWWGLMLCKFGWKNDAELTKAVKAKFSAAAKSGDGMPSTPFETGFGKNALVYDSSGRRRAFVDKLNAELAEIWRAERGKAPKLYNYKPKSRGGNKTVIAILTYVFAAIAVVGAMLTVYGMADGQRALAITGFVIITVFGIASFGFGFSYKRAGGSVKAAFAIMIITVACVAIAFLIIGLYRGSTYLVVISALVLAALAVIGIMNVGARRATDGPSKADDAPTKPQDRRQKIKIEEKPDKDEYKDDFD